MQIMIPHMRKPTAVGGPPSGGKTAHNDARKKNDTKTANGQPSDGKTAQRWEGRSKWRNGMLQRWEDRYSGQQRERSKAVQE